MVYFGIPVEGPRLVPYGRPRLKSDVLANGHDAFRVTQRFADRDYYWNDGRLHLALDVGNYVCGDKVLAAETGYVEWVGQDAFGARGIRLDHAEGYGSQYWHLAQQLVVGGQAVARGQVIGRVGSTGLGSICHMHFVITRIGLPIDPWPLLHQPTTTVPDTAADEGAFPVKFILLDPPAKAHVNPGVNIRSAPNHKLNNITTTTPAAGYDTPWLVGAFPGSTPPNLVGATWYGYWVQERETNSPWDGRLVYFHKSLCRITDRGRAD